MKKQLTTRLQDLQSEYKKGQERLTALEQEIATVKTSMLRISGAIQVLEEIIEETKETVINPQLMTENGTKD